MRKEMRIIEIKPSNAQFNDEQWQAIHQKGSNLLVAASAGSGKTTVLIERILTHLTNQYANLDELLVVTFTESAAKEMKERMEVSLKKTVSSTSDAFLQRHFLQQINLLPTAHIRTLHSFCLQVIQQFFYLVDFNPSFQLLTDETQKSLIYQDVWQDLLTDILNNEVKSDTLFFDQNDLVDLMNRFANARSDQGLFDIILQLYLFSSSHTEPTVWLENIHQLTADFDRFKASDLYQNSFKAYIQRNAMAASRLLQKGQDLLKGLSDENITKYEPVLRNEEQYVNQIIEANLSDDIETLMQLMQQVKFDRWSSARKTNEEFETINEIKVYRDDAKKIVTDRLTKLFYFSYSETKKVEEQISPVIQKLSNLTLLFTRYLAEHKQNLNIIDYNDLEHLTLDILAPYNEVKKEREASPAALYYQKLFKEVMVDEYQDINDIQATILGWLAHEHRPELSGNLFMVGDVKQSIYGFRMAEPSLFLDKYRKFAQSEGGELIVLDKNYRSRDEVLQFTNYIFERIMGIDFGEMEYGKQESLKTGNLSLLPEAPSEDFDIELLLYEKQVEDIDINDLSEEEELLIDTSIEAEVHLIAQDILNKIANGFQIYDKKNKGMKFATFNDIVILSSTRTPFLPIQQIFERYHIPVLTQKVENFFQRQEIRLMIALLKLIDNPIQDIPLVAILRSYFVGIDDEMLSKIRIASPSGDFYSACLQYLSLDKNQVDETISILLERFISQLNHWHELSNEVSLVELIWTIYQETNFLDYVAGLANGPQRQANLHAFYQKADEFEESSFKGLFGFIQYIEKVMQAENDLAEPVVLSENQNAVRTMTVHASKGLEFPIVYLINTGKKFNTQDVTQKKYIASKDYGIATDYYDYNTLLQYPSLSKQTLRINQENLLKAEEMRKLYVALTRCEQKLIIVGTVKNEDEWHEKSEKTRQLTETNELLVNTQERQSTNSWLEWIRQALAVEDSLQESVTNFTTKQVQVSFFNQQALNQLVVNEDDSSSYLSPERWLKHLQKIVDETTIDDASKSALLVKQLMRSDYEYELSTNTSSYQSVSELKRLYEEPRIEKIESFQDRRPSVQIYSTEDEAEEIQSIRYTQDTFEAPKFVEDKQMDYAQIGTITHFLLQQLNFGLFTNLASENYATILNEEVERLISEEYLDRSKAEVIQFDKISEFLLSELGQLVIKHSNRLKREQAFSFLLPANQLLKSRLDDMALEKLASDQLLVHGIIDNFIEMEHGLILLDYKTDRFRSYLKTTAEEQSADIIEKYKFQVSLYVQALAQAKKKPVLGAYLVLLDFGISIQVNDLYQFD